MSGEQTPREGSVKIRSYGPGDYLGCLVLYGAFRRFHQDLQDTPDTLYGVIQNEFDRVLWELQGNGELWVAESGPTLVGFVTVRLGDHDQAEIPQLFVQKSYRGYGVGRRLVDAALGWARAAGLKRIRAIAVIENPEALLFFTRIGFHRTRQDSLELVREVG